MLAVGVGEAERGCNIPVPMRSDLAKGHRRRGPGAPVLGKKFENRGLTP